MGSIKPLLPLGRTSYVGQVLATLAAIPLPRLVVVGAEAEIVTREVRRLDEQATILENPGWSAGMLSSVQVAVRHLLDSGASPALLLCPVDVPRFAPTTITAALAAFAATEAPLVLPCYHGCHGHPALFSRVLWAELLGVPAEVGARAVVEAHRDEIVEVEVDDPWILRDADTPQAHERMSDGLPS